MSTPEKDPEVAAAELEQAKAEAKSATTKARKEEREEREAAEPEAKAVRDAERRQKVAEAQKSASAAKRDEIAALIPDFKDVERGSLEDKSEKPLFSAALGQRALASAAAKLATHARGVLNTQDRWRLLVTSDADLATSDATYHDVAAGLEQLKEAAQEALREPDTADEPLEELDETKLSKLLMFAPVVAPVASAVAAAVPTLLGVFSAHRTLKSGDIQATDLAAAAAVAGALVDPDDAGAIRHDSFRLLPTDGVHREHADLVTLRRRLAALKLTLEQTKARTPASDDQTLGRIAARLALVESVSTAIDTFNASITAVPQGAARSPLGLAAAREELHPDDKDVAHAFTHALLVKADGGSVHQTIDDKPFLIDDKLSIIAAASITWMLIDARTSEVVGAGTAAGTATAHGTIGDRFDITLDDELGG